MASSLFNSMMRAGTMPNNGGNIIGQVMRFAQNYRGNAQHEVQQLLNSGQMSQAEFNNLREMASGIAGMINKT